MPAPAWIATPQGDILGTQNLFFVSLVKNSVVFTYAGGVSINHQHSSQSDAATEYQKFVTLLAADTSLTAPTVTSVSPTTIDLNAPVDLSIIGTMFVSPCQVTFRSGAIGLGCVAPGSMNFISSTELQVEAHIFSENAITFQNLPSGTAWDIEYDNLIGNIVTLPAALTITY